MPQCSHYGTEASDWFNPLELLAEGSSNGPALVVCIDCHVSVICYCYSICLICSGVLLLRWGGVRT
uniref:Uncharacterized protein n=1 Tax=Aegilops tauschii subsp. strangulata TaxID=200361 RepID=A0A453MC18_AEGTS